jgi:hypothetical protein
MHYHLIGICGTAMASLAGMLQARGRAMLNRELRKSWEHSAKEDCFQKKYGE